MAFDDQLADRVRTTLAVEKSVSERKMMGGICFMLGGNMCCGIIDNALIVRVGREGAGPALAKPHVRPLEFAGRRTGGFVLVDPPGYAGAAFARWIGKGVTIAKALPKKAPVKKAAKKTAPKTKRTKIGPAP